MPTPSFSERSNYQPEKAFVSVRLGTDAYIVPKETYEMQDILADGIAELIRKMGPSGCLQVGGKLPTVNLADQAMDGNIRVPEYESWSGFINGFQLNSMEAVIGGYLSRIAYSSVVNNPANKITLASAPSAGTRNDLVFLEVWNQLVSKDDPIYKWGGKDSGEIENDLLDERAMQETSRRIQRRWRIRVVSGVDFTAYPNGVNATNVKARGNAGTDTAYTYTMVSATSGYYRAGDGGEVAKTALSTVDGYSYAIPLFKVSRRNSGGYSVGNPNGARNYAALKPTVDVAWANFAGLAGCTFTVADPSVIPYFTVNTDTFAYSEDSNVTFQVTGVSGTSLTIRSTAPYLLSGSFGVAHELRMMDAQRPDGLYANIIDSADLTDLRFPASLSLKTLGDPVQGIMDLLFEAAGGKADLAERLDVEIGDDGKVVTGTSANQVVRRDSAGKIPGDILGNAATATDSTKLGGVEPGTGANQIAKRNSTGKVPGDITGDAATVGGKTANDTASNIALYDTNKRVYDSNRLAGYTPGTGAFQIAQRDADGNIPGTVVGSVENADKVDGYHAGNAASNVLLLDTNALVPLANIPATLTGKDAATVGGKSADDTASNIALYDANRRVYDSNRLAGNEPGTGANQIAKRDSTGKVPGDITGNAATATSATSAASATTAGYATTAGAAATAADSEKLGGATAGTGVNQIAKRDGTGKVPGDITGDAATVGGKSANDTASNIAVYDANKRVYDSNRLGGAAVGDSANQIPKRNVQAKVPGDITGDAATVGGKSADDTASNIALYDANRRVYDSVRVGGQENTELAEAVGTVNGKRAGYAVYAP